MCIEQVAFDQNYIKHNIRMHVYGAQQIIYSNYNSPQNDAACTNGGTQCSTADPNSECDLTTGTCRCKVGYSMGGMNDRCTSVSSKSIKCICM